MSARSRHRPAVLIARLLVLLTVAAVLLSAVGWFVTVTVRSFHRTYFTVDMTNPEVALGVNVKHGWNTARWGPLTVDGTSSNCGNDNTNAKVCLWAHTRDGVAFQLVEADVPSSLRLFIDRPVHEGAAMARLQQALDTVAPASDRLGRPNTPAGEAMTVLDRSSPANLPESSLRWVKLNGTVLLMTRPTSSSPWVWTLTAPWSQIDRVLTAVQDAQDDRRRAVEPPNRPASGAVGHGPATHRPTPGTVASSALQPASTVQRSGVNP